MIRIALLDDYQNVGRRFADWGQLPEGAEVVPFTGVLVGEDAVAEALRDFQVVMVMRERTPFPRTLLERLPELRLLATGGMRNAALDLEAATELGIVVCGTGGGGVSTMELTFALMLSVMRHLPAEHTRMGEGRWQETVGVGLAGKTLGLLGLGNIGAKAASVAQAFGMEVIAWSENLTDARAAECAVARVGREDLFKQADVLSVHLKLSERSRGLVGTREFGLMKPTAYLINTSRGPIVEERAMIDALESGRIAGAGLDVFDEEPLPAAHPLRGLNNVALTPHLGYVTEGVYTGFYGGTLENILSWLAGNPQRVLNEGVLTRMRPFP